MPPGLLKVILWSGAVPGGEVQGGAAAPPTVGLAPPLAPHIRAHGKVRGTSVNVAENTSSQGKSQGI